MEVLTDRTRASGPVRLAGRAGPKGEAIARAALRLFVRDGYERTSVDAIAAEAGVSKRTIYNRYGDKENLLLSVVSDTYRAMIAAFTEILDMHLSEIADLDRNLTELFRDAAAILFRSPERAALIRLMMAEAPRFPELLRVDSRPRRSTTDALAQRLAVLAAAGHLDITDPAEAAGHLFALTFGQINNRTLFGSVPMTDEEMERMITGGVRVFLRAYRPAELA
jgi:TetR/AcrR family transcriptional regulator, mexJK operon transcriptional repressor